jgi:LmbE family N-acetylglucosaminyl deacetylase
MIKDLRKVLILAAHPDDAEISVGGTIAKLTDAGTEVVVANFTTSEYTAEGRRRRRAAAKKAANVLGNKLYWVDGGKHNQVEDQPEYRLVRQIDQFVEAEQPDLVIGPWNGDSHTDHVRLARAAVASSRRWKADLLAYCPAEYRTVCFHRFEPNVFVDITPFVRKKVAAIEKFHYGGQGFRALETKNLAHIWSYYGALSGYEFAEGFLVLRCRIS